MSTPCFTYMTASTPPFKANMNANELADELTKMFIGEEYNRLIHEIPDLLRQQQAEIEALKKEKWLIEIECARQTLKQVIDMLTTHHDILACSSYPLKRRGKRNE